MTALKSKYSLFGLNYLLSILLMSKVSSIMFYKWIAAFVIILSWPPHDAFGWIIFGLGIVALGKGLSYIGPVLRRPTQVQNSKVHGDAGEATQAKSLDAARGGVEKPPWADHGYSD